MAYCILMYSVLCVCQWIEVTFAELNTVGHSEALAPQFCRGKDAKAVKATS